MFRELVNKAVLQKWMAIVAILAGVLFMTACGNNGVKQNENKIDAATGSVSVISQETGKDSEAVTLNSNGNNAKAITLNEFVEALEKIGYMDEDEFIEMFGDLYYDDHLTEMSSRGIIGSMAEFSMYYMYYIEEAQSYTGFMLSDAFTDAWKGIAYYTFDTPELAKQCFESILSEDTGTTRDQVDKENGQNSDAVVIQSQFFPTNDLHDTSMITDVLLRKDNTLIVFDCQGDLHECEKEMQMFRDIGYLSIAVTPKILEPRLSETCDCVLSLGYDKDGNFYELVANQTESSRGFEITVGVIKNNEWLYPLSSDFPFLEEDGLFHVLVEMSLAGDDSSTGTSLLHPNRVIDKLYFIDSGAFLMKCSKQVGLISTRPDDNYYLIFSCETLKACKIESASYYFDTLLFVGEDTTFDNGEVRSFGKIYTDDNKLVLTELNQSGLYQTDNTHNAYLLDAKTFEKKLVTKDLHIHPVGAYYWGLIMYSDNAFYDAEGNKIIDLSDYNIVSKGDAHFSGGKYTFIAKNDLGTRFEVTIDIDGNVISEVAQ